MPENKTRSLRALDALNFCNAGIQTGLGPFMSIFYTSVRHWNPGQIGILIALQSLAGVVLQPLVGHAVDESKHKRIWTAFAAVLVAAGAAGIALLPAFRAQLAVQLLIGMAVTVFPAATAAFALGMAGEGQLPSRVARNESFTHSGNLLFAALAGVLGTLVALVDIFYGAAVFALGMAVSALLIRQGDVSHDAARGGVSPENKEGGEGQPKGVRDLFRDRRILVFTAVVVLFNISNAATLPITGEVFSSKHKGGGSAGQIAAAVAVAELVMIGVAVYAGKRADQWGRKPLFLIAFAFLAVRNGVSVFSHNPTYLISLQAFDGVAAAIYGVLLTLMAADLAKGTGRFNLLQGAVQSAMGIGGFVSNLFFGFIAKSMGFNAAFLGLSAVAVAGGLFCQWKMPETREAKKEIEERKGAGECAPAPA